MAKARVNRNLVLTLALVFAAVFAIGAGESVRRYHRKGKAELLAVARAAKAANQTDRAMMAYDQAYGLDRGDLQIGLEFVKHALDLGMGRVAMDVGREVLQRHPENVEALTLVLDLAFEDAFNPMPPTVAPTFQNYAQTLLRLKPDTALPRRALAALTFIRTEATDEDREKARQLLREALAIDPKSWQSAYLLALFHHLAKDKDPAEAEVGLKVMQDFLAASAESPLARCHMARFLLSTGRRADALSQADLALQGGPEDTEVVRLVARLYLTASELEKARSAYQQLLKLRPTLKESYLRLAGLQRLSGAVDEALKLVKDGLDQPMPAVGTNERFEAENARLQLKVEQGRLNILKASGVEPAEAQALTTEAATLLAEVSNAVGSEIWLVQRLAGDVARAQGNASSALTSYANAIARLEPQASQLDALSRAELFELYQLTSMLYRQRNETGQAYQQVKRMLGMIPAESLPPQLLLSAAESALQASANQDAAMLASTAVGKLTALGDKATPDEQKLLTNCQMAHVLALRGMKNDKEADQLSARYGLGDNVQMRAAQLAQQLIGVGNDMAKREAILRDLHGLAPDAPSYAADLTRVLMGRGKVDEARALAEGLAGKPADSWQLQGLRVLLKPQPIDQSIAELSKLTPPAKALAYSGETLLMLGRNADAVKALEAAMALDPSDIALLERLFTLVTEVSKDAAIADALVAKAKAGNLDGAQGKLYQGRQLLLKGEAQQAGAVLSDGLKLSPTNSDGHFYLAMAEGRLGRPEQALAALDRALLLNPNNARATRLRALIMLQLQSEGYGAELAKAAKLFPDDAQLATLYEDYLDDTDPSRSLQELMARHEQDPSQMRVLQRLVNLLMRAGQLDATEAAIQKTLAARPGDLEAANLYAQVLLRVGKGAEAEALLKKSLSEVKPEQRLAAQLLLARQYLARGLPAETEAAYADVRQADPARPDLAFEQANATYTLGKRLPDPARVSKGLAQMAEAVALTGAPATMHRQRIDALLEDRRLDEAAAAIAAYEKAFPTDPYQQLVRGLHLQAQGKNTEALDALRQHLAAMPTDADARYRVAMARLRLNDITGAIGDLETLKREHPSAMDHRPRLQLAQLYQSQGNVDTAVRELEQVMRLRPGDPEPAVAMAQALVAKGEATSAITLIREGARRFPRDPRWLLMQGELEMGARNIEAARGTFKEAAQRFPASADAALWHIQTALMLGDVADADAAIAAMRARGMDRPELLSYGVMRSMITGAFGEADDLVDRMCQPASGVLNVSYLVSLHVSRTFGPRAEEMLGKWESASRQPGLPALLRAPLLLSTGKKQDALASMRAASSKPIPACYASVFQSTLAVTLQANGQFAESRKAFEEALKGLPDDFTTLNNLAFLLLDDLNLPVEALPYAERAAAAAPRNASILDTLGLAQLKNGKLGQAEQTLELALRLEQMPILHYHLGLVREAQKNQLKARQDHQEALRLLLQQGERADPDLRKKVDEALARVGG